MHSWVPGPMGSWTTHASIGFKSILFVVVVSYGVPMALGGWTAFVKQKPKVDWWYAAKQL